jgi:hypothetical protein
VPAVLPGTESGSWQKVIGDELGPTFGLTLDENGNVVNGAESGTAGAYLRRVLEWFGF